MGKCPANETLERHILRIFRLLPMEEGIGFLEKTQKSHYLSFEPERVPLRYFESQR